MVNGFICFASNYTNSVTGFHKTIKGIDFEFIIREELDDNYTYCSNCVEPIKKLQSKIKKTKKNWGAAPINETTENIKSLEVDKRTLKKTGRVHLFGTRVKKEWLTKLKQISYDERLKYVEVLEKALDCYEKHKK